MAIEVAEGISGSLSETPLTDFLRILAWNGRSGVLLAWDGPAQVGLFLNQGRLVRAQMTELIGAAIEADLLLSGRLGQPDFERARAAFRLPRANQWRTLRLLAADGALDEAGLVLAQETAIRETMRRALQWTRGELQFKPNVPPLLRAGLADLNVEALMIDGLRELDEHGRVVVTPATVVRWAPAPPPGLTAALVGRAHWETLRACTGKRTAAEVAAAVGGDLAVVLEQVGWLLEQGAVVVVPPPTPVVIAEAPGLLMEDRLVLLLSRFETGWPGGRLTPARAAGALVRIINAVAQAHLEHWQDLVFPEARERVWEALVLPDLARVVEEAALDLPVEPGALGDGQLVPARATTILQGAAEREPVATLHGLIRLLEGTLALVVGEIDRPVALVDGFESVNVFITELHQRLAELG